MITVAELFPNFNTAFKWLSVFKWISDAEEIRLEKEYTFKNNWIMYMDANEVEPYYCELYTLDEMWHRRDGPAYSEYYRNGNLRLYKWKFRGRHHRIDGPACVEFHTHGRIEIYLQFNKLHREDGPAIVHYDKNNVICKEEWFLDGYKTSKYNVMRE